MAEQIGSIQVNIGANPEELKKGLQNASKALDEFGKRATKLGKDISMKVTAPIVALGTASVAAFATQEKAEMRLRAALQANGRQVQSLFKDYTTFASELQKITVVGDEATIAMLQQAESLGLTGEAAKNAVKNAIAMQSAFNVNAESALRYTAALAQGDATMLTRYIPSLKQTEDASERVAIAQDVLSKAFAAATGEAESFSGQLQQTKNSIGDLMEQFGAIVGESMTPMIKRIQEVVARMQEMDDGTKQLIAVVAGLAAAVGPALIAIGQMARGLAALPGLFAAISGPVGLVVIGITALVAGMGYLNSKINEASPLYQRTREQVANLKTAYDELKKAQEALQNIQDDSSKYSEQEITNKREEAQAALKNAKAIIAETAARRESIKANIEAQMRAMQTSKLGGGAQAGAIKALEKNLKRLTEEEKAAEQQTFLLTKMLYDLENPAPGIDNTTESIKETKKAVDGVKESLDGVDFSAMDQFQKDLMGGTLSGLEMNLGLTGGDAGADRLPVEDWTQDWTDLEPMEAPIDIEGSEQVFNRMQNSMMVTAERAKQSASAIAQAFGAMGQSLFGDLQQSENAFQRFVGNIGAGIVELIGMLLANAVSNAILGGTQAGVATGPAAPFTTPAFIATAVGAVMAAFSAIPAFAQGGMVTGPTLAMVGDNASGKEAIIPFEKMGAFMNMMGGSNVNVNITGELQGDALRLVVDRSNKDNLNLR